MADGRCLVIAEGSNKRKRKVIHHLVKPVSTDSLKVIIESTNGSIHAELIEIRVYA